MSIIDRRDAQAALRRRSPVATLQRTLLATNTGALRAPQTGSEERFFASLDRILRANRASRLTDQAKVQMVGATTDQRAYELLVSSVRTDPTLVNAYAVLADLFARRGLDAYHELHRVWQEHGSCDPHALRFIEEYRGGDPVVSLAAWCARHDCGPALIVRAGDDVEFTDLYDYSGVSGEVPSFVGRVHDPKLVCSPRDFGGLPATKQAIAEDLVKRGKDFRVVSHRGTTIGLASRAVFGPAIDSLHFNAVLHRTVYRSAAIRRARRVAEIGVGSGFLVCSLLGSLPRRPLRIVGSDIDASAIATTWHNVRRALRTTPSADAIEFTLECDPNVLKRLPPGEVDLLICNPPYIPEHHGRPANPVSGTELIESAIADHLPRVLAPGGVAVVLHSSLAAAGVGRALARSALVPVTLAAGKRVPLDLREVGADPAWVEMLLHERGLEQTLDNPSYAYWHTLHITALCRPDDRALIDELETLAMSNGAS
jgi:hypothetical protein